MEKNEKIEKVIRRERRKKESPIQSPFGDYFYPFLIGTIGFFGLGGYLGYIKEMKKMQTESTEKERKEIINKGKKFMKARRLAIKSFFVGSLLAISGVTLLVGATAWFLDADSPRELVNKIEIKTKSFHNSIDNIIGIERTKEEEQKLKEEEKEILNQLQNEWNVLINEDKKDKKK